MRTSLSFLGKKLRLIIMISLLIFMMMRFNIRMKSQDKWMMISIKFLINLCRLSLKAKLMMLINNLYKNENFFYF